MSVYLSPTFGIGFQGFTVGGLPLNAGLLYTYIAGGTTPQATYTTYLGNVQNSNPITLGVDGRPPNEVWLTHGVSYRFDLKDSLGNLIKTYDNVSMSTFVSTDALSVSSGSSLIGFIQGGTSPVAETVQTALRRIVYPEQFGAVGDGSTDDRTALTNFINYLLANPQLEGRMLSKTYAISGALPQVNVSGVKLIGFGPSSNHDTGSINGTCLKAITNSGFNMLTVAPTEGVSSQRVDGVRIEGISFDGNSRATKALIVKSVRNARIDTYAEECVSSCYELGVVNLLGEACDLQDCNFRLYGRQISNSANVIQITGTSAANVSLNHFEMVDVVHKNATGIVCQNPDNNLWSDTRVYRAAGGGATNSIEWQGGSTEPLSTRWEVYTKLTATVAAIAKGTGTYTVAAKNIKIGTLDLANATPVPTVETGASVDGVWLTWTPSVSSTTGTITTIGTVNARYLRRDWKLYFTILIPITTNGTGAGVVRATLPFVSRNVTQSWTAPGIETAVNGIMLRGLIAQNSTNLDIQNYDATYPGADGLTLSVSGWYELPTTG